MPEYRRFYEPGGTYFFTVVTAARRPLFADLWAQRLLGEIMRRIKAISPFETAAIVLLPDHLHCLWTLPRGDEDFSTRWKAIKREFTVAYLAEGGCEARPTASQRERGHRGVWQRRFWEHLIRDETDFEAHLDYIHYNPVKHGYCARPWDWTASSFRQHVSLGQYDPEWGRSEPENLKGFDRE